MARTKPRSKGHAKQLAENRVELKRKREEKDGKRVERKVEAQVVDSGSAEVEGAGEGPAMKKVRSEEGGEQDEDEEQNMDGEILPQADKETNKTNPTPTPTPIPTFLTTLLPQWTELSKSHTLHISSVISSTAITKKVTRVLDSLSLYPVPKDQKENLVILHAKAGKNGGAGKLISIIEICKRELVVKLEGAKWFQYNTVGQVMEEKKAEKGMRNGKADVGGKGDEDEDGEEEEGFETMKTPFERAIEGNVKVSATPIMIVLLSRTRVETLRRGYGEQTNALT